MSFPERSMRLTMADVERLMSAPTAEAKVETATKILSEIADIKADPTELAIAQEIIERLAGDVEVAVRQGIAWQVAHSPLLTHNLAARMAKDVSSVAFPILRYARLPEDALIAACGENDPRKTLAVAGRKHISAKVSDAVISTENVKSIAVLLGNNTAKVNEAALKKVLEQFGAIPAINIPMSSRADLPAAIVEGLVGLVSTGVRNQLIETYQMNPEQASKLVQAGRESATVMMLKPVANKVDQLDPFVRGLHEKKQVTPSFLFRALCAGEINLFRVSLSVRGKIPLLAVDELLRDRGPLGMPALLRRCDIGMSLLPAFKAAIAVLRESGYSGGETGASSYQANVIAAVFEDCVSIDDAELDELLQHLFTPVTFEGSRTAQ